MFKLVGHLSEVRGYSLTRTAPCRKEVHYNNLRGNYEGVLASDWFQEVSENLRLKRGAEAERKLTFEPAFSIS